MSQIFFCFLPGILALIRVPATNPAKQLTFLLVFFRRRGEGCHFRFRAPANHWLLPFSPPRSGDFVRATRCHPSQVTVNSNSSHPTSIVSVGYHVTYTTMCLEIIYLIYIDIKQKDLALNNLQWLIGHKIKPSYQSHLRKGRKQIIQDLFGAFPNSTR